MGHNQLCADGRAGSVVIRASAYRQHSGLLGMHIYESSHGALPPSVVLTGTGTTIQWFGNWGVLCRTDPVLEQAQDFNAINFDLNNSYEAPPGHDRLEAGRPDIPLPERYHDASD